MEQTLGYVTADSLADLEVNKPLVVPKRRGRPHKIKPGSATEEHGTLTPEVEGSTPSPAAPADYDVRVLGPHPGSPGDYILILYDRPSAFGLHSTLYNLDVLLVEKGVCRGYLGGNLVLQFSKSLTYILVHKSQVKLEPSKDEESTKMGFMVPPDIVPEPTPVISTKDISRQGYL